jgi:hypothetical protein
MRKEEMTEKEKIEQAAEKCRQDWCEKIRPLTDEKTYQENKHSVGRAVIPFAFEAGAKLGIELERERAKVLIEALEYLNQNSLGWQGTTANEALAKYRREE